MKEPELDPPTRRDIDRVVARVLEDAGFLQPPVDMRVILETLKLDRDFYDLEDPGLLRKLRHRLLIGSRQLSEIVQKVKLQALLLFDDKRILLDRDLPAAKHNWADAHEAGHEIIPWHRDFCRGDTVLTLDPSWQEQTEAEANYAASALLFCGKVFTDDARDMTPGWAAIRELQQRYKKTLTTTARRYVREGPDRPMIPDLLTYRSSGMSG